MGGSWGVNKSPERRNLRSATEAAELFGKNLQGWAARRVVAYLEKERTLGIPLTREDVEQILQGRARVIAKRPKGWRGEEMTSPFTGP